MAEQGPIPEQDDDLPVGQIGLGGVDRLDMLTVAREPRSQAAIGFTRRQVLAALLDPVIRMAGAAAARHVGQAEGESR